jgi:hypothetical protein
MARILFDILIILQLQDARLQLIEKKKKAAAGGGKQHAACVVFVVVVVLSEVDRGSQSLAVIQPRR